jgi:hypothetical protein
MRVLFAALVACVGVAALVVLDPALAVPTPAVAVATLGAHAPWSVAGVAVLSLAGPWAWVLVDRRRARQHRVR